MVVSGGYAGRKAARGEAQPEASRPRRSGRQQSKRTPLAPALLAVPGNAPATVVPVAQPLLSPPAFFLPVPQEAPRPASLHRLTCPLARSRSLFSPSSLSQAISIAWPLLSSSSSPAAAASPPPCLSSLSLSDLRIPAPQPRPRCWASSRLCRPTCFFQT